MSERPLFTVVVPTIGRPTLPQTLASIDRDLAEVIVVADTFNLGDTILAAIEAEAKQWGARFYEMDAGVHDTGSPQLHLGYQLAAGRFVMNCGDDDVYEPDAFDLIAEVMADDPRPLMFKVELHPNGARGNTAPVVLWEWPEIERFNVTGQCFVCPNDRHLMGRWVDDVTFMRETIALHGGRVEWREELIARCY